MGKSTNQSGWTIRSPGPAIGPGARGAWEKGGSLAPGLTLCWAPWPAAAFLEREFWWGDGRWLVPLERVTADGGLEQRAGVTGGWGSWHCKS